MNHFEYRNGELYCEDVPLSEIAESVGTPCYVYSSATLTRHYRVFDSAFGDAPHHICYSVKACSNLAVLKLLANLGAGFDIVSGGELYRLQAAGIPTDKVVFSGVGKTRAEMEAALSADILCFNVESSAELRLLADVGRQMGKNAPVSVRVNPNVDAQTHPYISTGLKQNKFGIPWEESLEVYELAASLEGVDVVGLDCHIGSQLTQLEPFMETLDKMLGLVAELRERGHKIEHLDLGGGLGIRYKDETPPLPDELARAVTERTVGHDVTLMFEPGRVIVGNAGVLMTRVLYRKTNQDKQFVIVDAAMNDSIRPSLYDAYHEIQPLVEPTDSATEEVDVVGPICESGDFFAKNRVLPVVAEGDCLVLRSAGAYGFSMASNYNSRQKCAEVLVSGPRWHVVRQRESLADLVRGEVVPKELEIP